VPLTSADLLIEQQAIVLLFQHFLLFEQMQPTVASTAIVTGCVSLLVRPWSSLMIAVLIAFDTADKPAVTGTVTSTVSPAFHVVVAPRSQLTVTGLVPAFVQAARSNNKQSRSVQQGLFVSLMHCWQMADLQAT
jgi:hypothetical protein